MNHGIILFPKTFHEIIKLESYKYNNKKIKVYDGKV